MRRRQLISCRRCYGNILLILKPRLWSLQVRCRIIDRRRRLTLTYGLGRRAASQACNQRPSYAVTAASWHCFGERSDVRSVSNHMRYCTAATFSVSAPGSMVNACSDSCWLSAADQFTMPAATAAATVRNDTVIQVIGHIVSLPVAWFDVQITWSSMYNIAVVFSHCSDYR